MLSEPLQITLKVIRAFEQLEIPYLIGGSLASAVHGLIRATMDADVVADIQSSQVVPFAALLKTEFYIDEYMILDAIQQTSSFNLIHLDTMFKVDIFILKKRNFDINQMRRRTPQAIEEVSDEKIFFSTAEDIILAKLEWFQMGGKVSERQWRDILGVMNIQGNRLDFEYLHKWAEELGIRDLLIKAENEISE